MQAATVLKQLNTLADPRRAAGAKRFFKTGAGEYAEGDRFIGVTVPQLRQLAKHNRELSLAQTLNLLKSPWHEARALALLILVEQYKAASANSQTAQQKIIYQQYLQHSAWINNWDLVDSSAHLIVGPWLEHRSHRPLFTLTKSASLWERRIGIMSTFHFIRQNSFATTLTLVERLLQNREKEDLMHKACGWMLREIGRRDRALLRSFLDAHRTRMPRTMLRYAIEHFDPALRRHYLSK